MGRCLEFPERPGALSNFLELLRPEFNISLFHYRNYGGGTPLSIFPARGFGLLTYLDVGKVLAGIQVPPGKREALEQFLVQLEYPFIDETENAVYKKFMTTQGKA